MVPPLTSPIEGRFSQPRHSSSVVNTHWAILLQKWVVFPTHYTSSSFSPHASHPSKSFPLLARRSRARPPPGVRFLRAVLSVAIYTTLGGRGAGPRRSLGHPVIISVRPGPGASLPRRRCRATGAPRKNAGATTTALFNIVDGSRVRCRPMYVYMDASNVN